MNEQMAYLLGMITGNGEIKRGNSTTIVSVSIPHKNQKTFDAHDVKLYVKASITDIKEILEPLVGTQLQHTQKDRETVLYFEKPNGDYLIREIIRFCDSAVSHETIRVNPYFFSATHDEIISFLRGFADVTGYIRESNYAYQKPFYRVYLEIPHNWFLVIDICNLLKLVDIPVQSIDWAHPNMRDGNLVKYNEGKINFWKKEHQIKIFANEFMPVGFGIIHKQKALEHFSNELTKHYALRGMNASEQTHRFYWEVKARSSAPKPVHPCEDDEFIPALIRGRHFNTWKEIARELGYHE